MTDKQKKFKGTVPQILISRFLESIAKALNKVFVEEFEEEVPFCLVVFTGNPDSPDKQVQYVSNVKRDDAQKALTELLEHWKKSSVDIPYHKKQ